MKRRIEGPGKRTTSLIETRAAKDSDQAVIVLEREVQSGDSNQRTGRPPGVPARKSPQTVLSGVKTTENELAFRAAAIRMRMAVLQNPPYLICVVPTRMTEAWLLTGDAAIHAAVQNSAQSAALVTC